MTIDKVTGSDCLTYIDRQIGFAFHGYPVGSNNIREVAYRQTAYMTKDEDRDSISTKANFRMTTLMRWAHNSNNRIVGLVLGQSEEGGYEVALLGSEYIRFRGDAAQVGNMDFIWTNAICGLRLPYTKQNSNYHRDYVPSLYPTCSTSGYSLGSEGVPSYFVEINPGGNTYLNFDTTTDYAPQFRHYSSDSDFSDVWRINGIRPQAEPYLLTNNKATTMIFGHREHDVFQYPKDYYDNHPLNYISGNLYQWACDYAYYFAPKFIPTINETLFDTFWADLSNEDIAYTNNKGCNLSSVPFNIILTYDENQAKRYLQEGTLPSDAFLFPLDFNDLPKYQSDETDDSDEDDGGDGDVDDNGRDTDENLPEVPPYTPGSLNNNNVYLMTPGELNQIVNWLWNDVGNVQDIDDLVTKIEGLTSDLTQNLLMIRVMPVAPSWIGGLGSASNFVIGAVEKAGEYTTLGKANPTIEEIGYWDFSEKFSSFKFLNFAPYSEFKLYLPYHGIVDLDVSVFQGHRLNVKAVYDYLTGTITYMLYCDNTWLVNTYTAKMAVDLAITLQTKADRDSAIFNNVSNAVAGVMTAGSSIAAGNPIGLVLGAQSLTQQGQSAPFKAMGQVGETGAFYAPQKCAVLVRRPVYRKPKTYNSSVGRQSYKSYTLAKLKGKGYTKIINPRLEFTKTQPLAEEVQELNDLLSNGVIL